MRKTVCLIMVSYRWPKPGEKTFAANAEESASASEEMNAQAGQLKDLVNELVMLINGSGKSIKSIKRERVVI